MGTELKLETSSTRSRWWLQGLLGAQTAPGPGAHTQDTRGLPRRLTLQTLRHTAAGSPAPRIATPHVSEAFCEVSCDLLNFTWWQTDGPYAGGGSQAGHLLLTKCVCGGCDRGADGFESGLFGETRHPHRAHVRVQNCSGVPLL